MRNVVVLVGVSQMQSGSDWSIETLNVHHYDHMCL